MGIQVKCPHGHTFKVKDKYAGKRGLCPHCKDQVVVEVPDISSTITEACRKAAAEERSHAHTSSGDDSIFDDEPHQLTSDTSGSLLGSSVIQHNTTCEFCNESVPMWFAKCPACGHFIDHR